MKFYATTTVFPRTGFFYCSFGFVHPLMISTSVPTFPQQTSRFGNHIERGSIERDFNLYPRITREPIGFLIRQTLPRKRNNRMGCNINQKQDVPYVAIIFHILREHAYHLVKKRNNCLSTRFDFLPAKSCSFDQANNPLLCPDFLNLLRNKRKLNYTVNAKYQGIC